MYICVYIDTHVCVYIYIYIYILFYTPWCYGEIKLLSTVEDKQELYKKSNDRSNKLKCSNCILV